MSLINQTVSTLNNTKSTLNNTKSTLRVSHYILFLLHSHVLPERLLAAGRGRLVVPPGATLPAANKKMEDFQYRVTLVYTQFHKNTDLFTRNTTHSIPR